MTAEEVASGKGTSFLRGFTEVTQEVNVLRELRPGDGMLAPGISELRDEHLREVDELCVGLPHAADHGYRELVTDMVEDNVAMRAVNERLGYRPLRPVFIVSGNVS